MNLDIFNTAPQDITENMRSRLYLLEAADKDQELQRLIIEKCRKDVKWFVDMFCWTYDPREPEPHKPFILWPKQRELIDFLDILYNRSQTGEKINVVIDKPRGVGVSYVILIWLLHKYLFVYFTARIGSRKEDYVDKKGDADTLFYKLDYNINRLPKWLKQDNERAYMILKNDRNSIVGESANPDFGRGGRKNAIFFDEYGFWDWAKSSWESSGESTNMRIAVSTPPESGKDSHFYKLLTGQAGRVEKFEFDYTDDPRRDSKWLEQAKETKSEEEFAREVLKSFEGTTEGKVYAISLRQADLTQVDYNPELPLFISWDFGLDSVAMIWWQKDFRLNKVKMIDCYDNTNKSMDFYIPFVTGVVESGLHTYSEAEIGLVERHKQWSKTITHFGDPDVAKRNLINKDSVKDFLYRKGIYVQSQPFGGREWNDLKQKTLLLFRRLEINENRCEPVLSALRNAKYPQIRAGSQRTNEPIKPIHDYTSHFRTSVEYFADNEPETTMTRTVVQGVSTTSAPLTPHEQEQKREADLKQIQNRIQLVINNTSTSQKHTRAI